MRSDPRTLWALALGLALLASTAPVAASRGPTVAIVTSSRVGPFETARIASLTLNYDTPLRGLSFSGGVYNFFNHSYPDPASAEFRQDRIPQDGVTFRLQLRYAF